MSHDYHERLPGFDPQQILVDGCRECEARSKRNDHGISTLDPDRFDAAYLRAQLWQTDGLVTVSDAERPLLDTLNSVRIAAARAGWWLMGSGVSRLAEMSKPCHHGPQ